MRVGSGAAWGVSEESPAAVGSWSGRPQLGAQTMAFISCSSGGWKFKIKAMAWEVGWEPSSWPAAVSSHGGGGLLLLS